MRAIFFVNWPLHGEQIDAHFVQVTLSVPNEAFLRGGKANHSQVAISLLALESMWHVLQVVLISRRCLKLY